jgi:hypothetical protein
MRSTAISLLTTEGVVAFTPPLTAQQSQDLLELVEALGPDERTTVAIQAWARQWGLTVAVKPESDGPGLTIPD